MDFGKKKKGKSEKKVKVTAAHVRGLLREAGKLPKQTLRGKLAERDAIAKLTAKLIDMAHEEAEVCLSEAKKASKVK